MPILAWIVGFCLIGGMLTVIVASVLLAVPQEWRRKLEPHLVSFATGVLLGAAFLGLLPHALSDMPSHNAHEILFVVLVGLLIFFLLEKLLLWRHCHAEQCEAHDAIQNRARRAPAGFMLLIGDAMHSLVDGVLIGAAFLSDIHLGIITSLAIAAHEVPQQLGNFVVLLQSGFSRSKAFTYSAISSLSAVVGGILAYVSINATTDSIPYVLALASSSFIYIAVADLIPGLHKRAHPSAMLDQIILIIAGIGLIYIAHSSLH